MPSGKTSSAPETFDETQTSEERDYEEHSGALPSNSVYDFLYQDVRRVGSFLAQFQKYGPRTNVKAIESVGSAQTVKGAALGTLGLPAVMGLSAALDTSTTDDTKDVEEHTFDPLWSNARLLLDYLASGNHISRNAWNANLGSFVQITGSILICDLQNIKTILSNPILKREISDEWLKSNGAKKGSPEAKNHQRGLELMQSMPPAIQMHVLSTENDINVNAWATISHESLTTTPTDLMLKHGIVLRGLWTVIGILDAFPDMKIPTEEDPNPQSFDEIAIPTFEKDFARAAAEFGGMARELIGRPRNMFGVTPILIFREVTQAT
ncbi:hypothetical protein ACFZ8E_05805 [Methylobacterium sp. HMF5984]|uniref:DUF6414 family protein n=1 Tax=Methylobacterium sp. HMF5984 TaxID=3367370 RepID=UPI0038541CF7